MPEIYTLNMAFGIITHSPVFQKALETLKVKGTREIKLCYLCTEVLHIHLHSTVHSFDGY